LLKDNPNFFEDNGFEKIDNKGYHYFGCTIAKGNNKPVYRKQLYINYDYEEESAVYIFPANIGGVNHEYLMAIYEWNNAGGDSCPLKLVRLVTTIEQYNKIITDWKLDDVEGGSYLLKP
jgi:hypothetical protein